MAASALVGKYAEWWAGRGRKPPRDVERALGKEEGRGQIVRFWLGSE